VGRACGHVRAVFSALQPDGGQVHPAHSWEVWDGTRWAPSDVHCYSEARLTELLNSVRRIAPKTIALVGSTPGGRFDGLMGKFYKLRGKQQHSNGYVSYVSAADQRVRLWRSAVGWTISYVTTHAPDQTAYLAVIDTALTPDRIEAPWTAWGDNGPEAAVDVEVFIAVPMRAGRDRAPKRRLEHTGSASHPSVPGDHDWPCEGPDEAWDEDELLMASSSDEGD